MSDDEPKETRKERERLTKRAVAEILRTRIARQRLHQTVIARDSGISRTHLRCLLGAQKQMSLFIFLELSRAMNVDDPGRLINDILKRRELLLARHPPTPPTETP